MKRCLLVEPLPWHEELFPNWVCLLNELGYFVDIVTCPEAIQKNSMASARLKSFRYRDISDFDELIRENYEFLIVNTLVAEGYEPVDVAGPIPTVEFLKDVDLPTISVIHEPAFFLEKAVVTGFDVHHPNGAFDLWLMADGSFRVNKEHSVGKHWRLADDCLRLTNDTSHIANDTDWLITGEHASQYVTSDDGQTWSSPETLCRLRRKPLANYTLEQHLQSPKNVISTVSEQGKLRLQHRITEVACVCPVYFGDFDAVELPRHLVFPGMLHGWRKNFDSLFQAKHRLADLTTDLVCVAGGARSAEEFDESRWVRLFRERVVEHQLKDVIHFTGLLDGQEFFDFVRRAKMILPLVDFDVEDGAYRHKLTTSVSYSMAFGVPLIVNEDIAAQYQMDYMICYPGGDLSLGIERFLQLSESDYRNMVAQTIRQREAWRTSNRTTLATLIERIVPADSTH